MGAFSVQALLKPISPDAPCGPDLELAGDAQFMNFTAQLEGLMPASFFAFDRTEVDFPAEFKTISALLAKSVDARLLVFGAKLSILNRDLVSYVEAIQACAALLAERWEDFRPELMGGDATLRNIALQALDDSPDSVMPLQSAPLFKTRRYGALTFRHVLLSEGKIQPRMGSDGEPEKVPAAGDLRGAVADADLDELVGARDRMAALAKALADIEAIVDEKSGPASIRYAKLKPLVGDILTYLDGAVGSRDAAKAMLAPVAEAEPAFASGGGGSPSATTSAPAAVSTIASMAEARAVLEAAARYFETYEPSSPSRLFLAQACNLVGKSFYEALSSLVPDYVGQARVKVMRDLPLTLTVEQISRLLPRGEQDGDKAAGNVSVDGIKMPETREAALRMVDEASKFFRAKEPSSPIPFLLDQARGSIGKDFVGLLREMLPRSALQVDT